jgi:hypothetical protein
MMLEAEREVLPGSVPRPYVKNFEHAKLGQMAYGRQHFRRAIVLGLFRNVERYFTLSCSMQEAILSPNDFALHGSVNGETSFVLGVVVG